MSLVRHEPWRLLGQLHGEFGRLLDGGTPRPAQRGRRPAQQQWVPAVDIKEEETRYVIHADVPGVEPADIDVSMEDGVLTIRGERAPNGEPRPEGYTRLERVRGRFLRRFSLPDSADAEAVSATSRHGVLEVVIPKQKRLQPRRIQVES